MKGSKGERKGEPGVGKDEQVKSQEGGGMREKDGKGKVRKK